MVRIGPFLLGAISLCAAAPTVPLLSEDEVYPFPHNSSLAAHDPTVIKQGGFYYASKGGIRTPLYKSTSLDGPWELHGHLFEEATTIQKENGTRPWAPYILQRDGQFFCYYSISLSASQDSAIGVLTADDIESESWKDHGAIIHTKAGSGSNVFPFSASNAIDAQVFIDPKDNKPYLNYGSYWTGIYQVALDDDLLGLPDIEEPDYVHLASLDTEKDKLNDIEGSAMSYKEPYYYLWFSRGKCCDFGKDLPEPGKEYSIRVSRSNSARGPFVDKNGVKTTEGGGHIVYASNNNNKVYAPGGLGILSEEEGDILYYHFLNPSLGLANEDAYLGWSYLEYVDGWPVPKWARDENLGEGLDEELETLEAPPSGSRS